jgi:predicted O-methyltransferase YrrM
LFSGPTANLVCLQETFMTLERNAAIKRYIFDTFVEEDEMLRAIKRSMITGGLPVIAVPENVGKVLYLLARLRSPKRILEIGTLAGYSTLWLARGAPTAHITTIEGSAHHASVASVNFAAAQINERVRLIQGNAEETLNSLIEEGEAPFDLIFLDADKENYPTYLPLMMSLSQPGTLILSDNLIPKEGGIGAPAANDLGAQGIYRYNQMLAADDRLESILLPMIVGDSGRVDALGLTLVK